MQIKLRAIEDAGLAALMGGLLAAVEVAEIPGLGFSPDAEILNVHRGEVSVQMANKGCIPMWITFLAIADVDECGIADAFLVQFREHAFVIAVVVSY